MDIARFEAEQKRLFKLWGLELWRFEYGKRKRSLGVCYFARRMITVTKFHVENDSEKDVLDTLMHEIAHAKAGYEPGNVHGPRFKMWAARIGCTVDGCAARAGTHLELAKQPGRYQAVCIGCGHTHHKYKMSLTKFLTATYICKCGQKGLRFRDTEASKPVPPVEPRKSKFF